MSDYISREDVLKGQKTGTFANGICFVAEPCVTVKYIESLEPANVAPVVRCKDCKYWRDSWVAPDGKHEHGYCYMEDADDVIVGRWGDDFCSYGERRTPA